MMNVNEVKKELLRNKSMARLIKYISGNIYFVVSLEDGDYQFPIATIDTNDIGITLASDLGTTTFYDGMKASSLNRWIEIAILSGDFIKINGREPAGSGTCLENK
jgi:uncharacterized protein (UPF0128 family)